MSWGGKEEAQDIAQVGTLGLALEERVNAEGRDRGATTFLKLQLRGPSKRTLCCSGVITWIFLGSGSQNPPGIGPVLTHPPGNSSTRQN